MKQSRGKSFRSMNLFTVLLGINELKDDKIKALGGILDNKFKKDHRKIEEIHQFTHMYPLEEDDLPNYLSKEQMKKHPTSNKFIWFHVPFETSMEGSTFLGLLFSFCKFDQTVTQIIQNRGPSVIRKHWIVFYHIANFLHFLYKSESPANLVNHKERYLIQKSPFHNSFVIRSDFYWMEFYRMHSYLFLIKNPNNRCLIHPVISRFFEFAHIPINYHIRLINGKIEYYKERFKYLATFKKWLSLYCISFMLLGWEQKANTFVRLMYKYSNDDLNAFLFFVKPFPNWIESRSDYEEQKSNEDEERFEQMWKHYNLFFHKTLTLLTPTLQTIIDSVFYDDLEKEEERLSLISLKPSNSNSNNRKNPLLALGSILFIETIHVIEKSTFYLFYDKFREISIDEKSRRTIFWNEEDQKLYKNELSNIKMKNKKAEFYKNNYIELWEILEEIKKYNDFRGDSSNYLIIDRIDENTKKKLTITGIVNEIVSQECFSEDEWKETSTSYFSTSSLSSSSPSLSYDESEQEENIFNIKLKRINDKEEIVGKNSLMILYLLTFGYGDDVRSEDFTKEELASLHSSISCLSKEKSTKIKERMEKVEKKEKDLDSTSSSKKRKRKSTEEKENNPKKKRRLDQEELMFKLYQNSWTNVIENISQDDEEAGGINKLPLPPFLKPIDVDLLFNPDPLNYERDWSNHNIYKWAAIVEVFFYFKRNRDEKTKEKLKENLLYIDQISTINSSVLLNPMEILLNLTDDKNIKKVQTRKQNNKIRTKMTTYELKEPLGSTPLWDLESIMIIKFRPDEIDETAYKNFILKYQELI